MNMSMQEELKNILHQYISEDELDHYKTLGEKINLADDAIKQYIQSKITIPKNSEENENVPKPDGPLPHYINISVIVEVMRSDSKTSLPHQVLQEKKHYEIDFIAEDHSIVTQNIFEEIHSIIENKCKKIPMTHTN